MGKQKLTPPKVEMVKHLIKEKRHTLTNIGGMVGVSREQISKIKKGTRWGEVETPEALRGEYLYLKYLNGDL
jgi:transcriptional regulator with XRE-family HTH domain